MDPNGRQHEDRSPEVAPVVFISYAREDESFLHKLTACLEAAGIRPVGDWRLPAAVDYRERLRAFILDSNSFLFAISPDSVASESCRWELETALEHQKRIVPLVWKEPPLSNVPEALRLRQWIFLRNDSDFERESARLEATIRDDLEGAQEHQYWEERAVDWRDRGSSLLRDKQLQEAERWLERAEAKGKDPQPTMLQRAFLKESRRAEARRLWTLRSAVTGVIVILAVAATLLFLQLRKTEEAKAIAEGNLATGLAQIPGRDADALAVALKAAGSNKSGALPIEIADGIANAVASTDLSRILPGHSTQVKSAVLSPDSRLLATEAGVGSIRIWEFGTGRPLKNFEQKESAILSMDLAAGGRRLVADGFGLAVLWDVLTGKRLAVIKNGSSPGRSRFSRDGTRLLVYSGQSDEDGYVASRSLLDAEDGRRILVVREASPSPWSTSFSPDGSLLAVGLKTGTIRIWSTSTGSLVQELRRHTGPIENITFTPDGKALVSSGEGGDTALCFWDLETGESRLRIEVSRSCRPVFSPNSRHFLCTTRSEEIEVRETASGKLLRTLAMKDTPHVSFAMDGSRLVGFPRFNGKGVILSFPEGEQIKSFEVPASMPGSPELTTDSRRILIVSQDGGIRILDARTGEPVWESVRKDSLLSLLVASRDGEALVLVGADRIPRLWRSWVDPAFGSLLGLTSPPFEVAFSPDGSRIATSGGGAPLLLWDARTGREIARLGDDFRGAWRVSYSADGRRLVTIGRDNLLRVWDAKSGKLVFHATRAFEWGGDPNDRFNGRSAPLSPFEELQPVLSSEGTRIATTFLRRSSVEVWRVDRRDALGEPWKKPDEIFSPQGTAFDMVFAGKELRVLVRGKTLSVWEARSDKTLASIPSPEGGVSSGSLSPDGTKVAFLSSDGALRLWNTGSGDLRVLLRVPASLGLLPEFSPGGDRIVLATADGTLRIWDTATGEPVFSFQLPGRRDGRAVFSPDGKRLATWGDGPTVRIWPATVESFIGIGEKLLRYTPQWKEVRGSQGAEN